MGFKCPNCKKDFGRDKQSFNNHLVDNPKCKKKADDLFFERIKQSNECKGDENG